MSIIRDVREGVLTKVHKLQPQAPGNEVLVSVWLSSA